METITNAVNAVSGTVTKAIYGEQKPAETDTATTTTTGNETGGNEPVSGLQGKGTATEPYDQGNAEDATNTGNTTSLPIREKSSLDTTNTSDLSAKPTIPSTNTFNSATAANASTLGQTSAITSRETGSASVAVPAVVSESQREAHVDPEASANPEAVAEKKQVESELLQGAHLGGSTLGHGSVGAGDAGVGETKNLAATLSETKDTSGVSSDFKSLENPTSSTTAKSLSNEPGLAGFGDKPAISPSDESQLPSTVSGIASASSQRLGDGNAGASETAVLSETLSKTEDSAPNTGTGKHDAPFVSSKSANAQQAATPAADPIDTTSTTGASSVTGASMTGASSTAVPSPTTGTSSTVEKTTSNTTGPPALEHTEIPSPTKDTSKDNDRLVESAYTKNESSTSHSTGSSPSGEKEKVSKIDKLKEKLHIGHKH